jgi:beta-xylosidase
MYVVYGDGQVNTSQLAVDGFSVMNTQKVSSAAGVDVDVGVNAVEEEQIYKTNGNYYMLNDKSGGTTFIGRSKSPWGPYEAKELVSDIKSPVTGGSPPHQGSLNQAANDK